MYKKIKVDSVAIDSEDGSESIVSEMLDRTESSLSHMTLSQSSSDDPSFRVNITPTDNCTEYIEIPMKRTISTHRYCCLCSNTSDLSIIPQKARMQSFIKRRVFIPDGNRCCRTHLINKRFYDESLDLIRVYSNWTSISSVELSNMMDNFAVECDSTLLDKMEDYRLSDEKLRVLTGLKWENVIELRNWLVSMRNTNARSVTQAIVVFLVKLRTGNSNKLISTILDINEEQLVSKYCEQVIESFENDVLPSRFGLNAVSRDDLIENHTSAVPKKLHNDLNDKLILIFDGTYARHEKSSNNEYQRKSYSGQKKVPLCKPFTICTTDGYIVLMLGPYYANQNDATIMRDIIDNPDGICHLLEPGDALVVDRGFRDVKEYLENKNYKVLMPAFKGKKNQLTTAESNASRNVTKIRWAVGCCSHVAAVVYYLSHGRYLTKILRPAEILSKLFDTDNVSPVIEEDSDED